MSSSKVKLLSESELSNVKAESAAGGWKGRGLSIEVTRAEEWARETAYASAECMAWQPSSGK